MIRTEAWVLRSGAGRNNGTPLAKLRREPFTFPEIAADEVLVEPIYGCWEGNMGHALRRQPVDICEQRREERVVLGNAGVVRVRKVGRDVSTVGEGDFCILFCNGIADENGYPEKIFAYDAPNTIGLLAKRTKVKQQHLIPIPHRTRHTLRQWAAFSLRYITAWANWRVAYRCWRAHFERDEARTPRVWGWGGGVSFAELTLARLAGCETVLLSSWPERLRLAEEAGLTPFDRRSFRELSFDPERYAEDEEYRAAYLASEGEFLDRVREMTGGRGVSIFVDFIGSPVLRLTLKSLGRPGILATAGWKAGMELSLLRALECMNWHTHVHTHYARYGEACEAVRFAEDEGWLPPVSDRTHDWDDIQELASCYASEQISDYYPIYQVNAV